MKITIPLYLIAIGIACIALQNAGIIKPYKICEIEINGSVSVDGGTRRHRGGNPVEVEINNLSDLAK